MVCRVEIADKGGRMERGGFHFEVWLIEGDIASKMEVRFVDGRFKSPRYYTIDNYILFEPKSEKIEEWLGYWGGVSKGLGLGDIVFEKEVTGTIAKLKEEERKAKLGINE